MSHMSAGSEGCSQYMSSVMRRFSSQPSRKDGKNKSLELPTLRWNIMWKKLLLVIGSLWVFLCCESLLGQCHNLLNPKKTTKHRPSTSTSYEPTGHSDMVTPNAAKEPLATSGLNLQIEVWEPSRAHWQWCLSESPLHFCVSFVASSLGSSVDCHFDCHINCEKIITHCFDCMTHDFKEETHCARYTSVTFAFLGLSKPPSASKRLITVENLGHFSVEALWEALRLIENKLELSTTNSWMS